MGHAKIASCRAPLAGAAFRHRLRAVAVVLAAAAPSPLMACPWHGVTGSGSDRSATTAADFARFPSIYVVDRMTGKEVRYDLGVTAVDLPYLHGFSCKLKPAADADLTDTFSLVCSGKDGKQETLNHSCKVDGAPIARAWNGFDRMGVNVVTVVLGCERLPDDDGRT